MAVDMVARMMAMGSGGGTADAYTKAETDQLLDGKADLVGGKVPASELPAMSIDSLSDTAVDTPENGEVLKYDADQGKWVNGTASGGGGTTDYTDLTNKPKINNVTLSGNKTASDLGITEMELGETSTTAYAGNKGKANADAITAIKDGQSIDSFGDVETALADKVDKVSGKGLSTEDYTTAEKTKLAGIASGAEVNVQSDWSQSDSTSDDYIKNKPTIPTVNDAALTIQKNGTAVGTFSANAATAATINITVPVDADDVSALPDTTKYGASLSLSIDSTTYVVTASLKDQDGNTLGTAQTIDLPIETVVVGGSYDDTTKKVILTLKNGSTIDFSVADLVAGLQTEITSTNKLDADLVDDTTSAHKFVTAADKSAWNAKSDFSGSYNDLTDKPTIPAAQVNADWNAVSGVAQILNKPTIPAVDQTYNSASTNAQSGTAVASAISGKISATDYATQNTGGTIKAWTTTDGSDTILHLATQ